jgi:outer membrane biosynthesis protein TonB
LVVNLLAIIVLLSALCAGPRADAQVIFDGSPDPSLVYPANRQLPKDNEATDANPATESADQGPQSKTDDARMAWITWHARINKEIAKRFTSISEAFRGGTAHVVIKYSVAKDKQIRNASVDQKSSNLLLNAAAMAVVNSLNNDPILQFPDGYDGFDVQMQAEFNAPSRYENWHDERDREVRHTGEFKYVW